MKTLRLLLMLLTVVSLASVPSHADDANTPQVIRDLDQSAASFKQGNYMMGVMQETQACELLKRDPAAGDMSYADLAEQCIQSIEQNIQNLHVSHDFAGATAVASRVYALQPLFQRLENWEPTNPRWHYEAGVVHRMAATATGNSNPEELRNAIAEFHRVVAMGGGEYSAKAESQLAECSRLFDKRASEIDAASKGTSELYSSGHGHTGWSYVHCANCGARHRLGQPCYICGSNMTKGPVEVDR